MKLVATALAAFVLAITINVVFHEIGHFLIADSFGYHPTIHFLETPKNGQGVATSASVAYVSYNGISNFFTKEDGLIALGGPIINLLFTFIAGAMYFAFGKKNIYLDAALLIFMLVSLTAFISNMIPLAPSDGFIFLHALA